MSLYGSKGNFFFPLVFLCPTPNFKGAHFFLVGIPAPFFWEFNGGYNWPRFLRAPTCGLSVYPGKKRQVTRERGFWPKRVFAPGE